MMRYSTQITYLKLVGSLVYARPGQKRRGIASNKRIFRYYSDLTDKENDAWLGGLCERDRSGAQRERIDIELF